MSRNDLPNEKAPNFNARLRETLMTYLGKSGDPLDRGITLRDLVESGIATVTGSVKGGGTVPLSPGSAIGQAVAGAGGATEPDLTPPPTPTGFAVTPAITTLLLEHDTPIYSQGHGHLRTHVYGAIRSSQNDPAPVFADAAEITQFSGTVASYATNPSTTWHLWIKWESVDGVLSASPAGGVNGVEVTTGQDVALLLSALTGEITSSQLYIDLSSRIDLIDGNAAGSVNARLVAEAQARTTALAAEAAARANAIRVALQDYTPTATLQQDYYTKTGADAAIVNATTNLVTTNGLSNALGNYATTATLQQNYYTKSSADAAISSATSNLVSASGLSSALSDYTTTAALQQNYYTKTGADAAISSATSGLVSTTALNNKLGDYTTTATLQQDYYTKTGADAAISSATSGLVSTSGLSNALADYTTTATLQQDYYTKTGADAAISSATSGLVSTTGLSNALGNYTTTALLEQNYYTKTGADNAISSATSGLVSTTALNNKLGDYTTTASLQQDYYTKTGADAAISNATSGLVSTTALNNKLGDYTTTAALQQDYYTKTGADAAISNATSTLVSTSALNNALGSYTTTAALQQTYYTKASGQDLEGRYSVKVDLNGYVTGFGLSSTVNNGTPTSSFMVRADRFSIVNPNTNKITIASATSESNFFGSFSSITTSTAHGLAVGDYVSIAGVPEIVGQHQVTAVPSTTQFSINQYSATFTITSASSVSLVTVPFIVTGGVTYIRTAMIQDATITTAKIGDLAITNGKIASIGVDKLDAGSLKVGSYLQSTAYTPGSVGWRINANGNTELNNITARGTIYASGGTVGGITIDSVGLRSGQTAWNVGSGFYIGNDGKFSIGTPGSKYLTWDNSLLKFSGSLEAANGTFSGALNAATGTFSGALSAGVVDLSAVVGQSYTYATAGTYTVVTMPYAGTVRVKLIGGGGGGGGGRGNTDARTDYSGLSGSYGSQYDVTITNVPKDYVVKVVIGAGGAGGTAGAVGNAGNATYIQIYNASNVLQTQYSASGGAGGTHYRYNDNPDSGLSGSLVARANSHSFRFSDAGDGAGWGSGQSGLAAPDIPGSAGGVGGFYTKEAMVYWGSLTEARRADLNGGNGVRGGGGGGGMATRGRAFSNGGFIGYRSAVYDSSDGGTESNGGNGGDGYAFVEIFNPNGVVLASEFQALKTGLQADQSVGLYNWQTVFNTPATSGSVDVVATYGQGLYYFVYSVSYGVDGGVNGGTLLTATPLNSTGWSKPTGNQVLDKRVAYFDDASNQYIYNYLRYIYKANFKVVGSI